MVQLIFTVFLTLSVYVWSFGASILACKQVKKMKNYFGLMDGILYKIPGINKNINMAIVEILSVIYIIHQTVDVAFSWKNSLVFCSACGPSPPLPKLQGTGQ